MLGFLSESGVHSKLYCQLGCTTRLAKFLFFSSDHRPALLIARFLNINTAVPGSEHQISNRLMENARLRLLLDNKKTREPSCWNYGEENASSRVRNPEPGLAVLSLVPWCCRGAPCSVLTHTCPAVQPVGYGPANRKSRKRHPSMSRNLVRNVAPTTFDKNLESFQASW